ncbi:MAG: hypothetical protein R6W96_01225 [Clostridia bacterium]
MKKRWIIWILSLSMACAMSSCNKPSIPKLEIPDIYVLSNSTDGVEMVITAMSYATPSEEYMTDFEKIIKEKYGIKLDLNVTHTFDLSGSQMADRLAGTGKSGIYLFNINSLERLYELRKSNSILPLDEYLAGNPAWEAMPEGMRSMFVLDDGNAWALTRGYQANAAGRVYRRDYLEVLGAKIPGTLDEFYELCMRFKAHEGVTPDENTRRALLYVNASSLIDVFFANGTPIMRSHNLVNHTSILYNPFTGSYEDSMLLPAMPETLSYVKMLLQQNLMSMASAPRGSMGALRGDITGMNDDRYLSGYGVIPVEYFGDSRYVTAYGLNGAVEGATNPLTYDYSSGFYVMGINTKDPGRVINAFVTVFYGDKEGHLLGRFGLPGTTYTYERSQLEVLDMAFFAGNRVSLVLENPLFSHRDFNILVPAGSPTNQQHAVDAILENLDARERYVNTGLMENRIIPLTPMQSYPEIFSTGIQSLLNPSSAQLFDAAFDSILRSRTSVHDGIAEYTKNMKAMGMQNIIDRYNELVKASTRYKY